jgi:hypothetical protein
VEIKCGTDARTWVKLNPPTIAAGIKMVVFYFKADDRKQGVKIAQIYTDGKFINKF